MIVTPSLRRIVSFVVRNWPLKLGAVVLATILYAGFVLSQDTSEFVGRIRIEPRNQPTNAVLLSELRDVELIRFIAPAELGRLGAEDFLASVDLADVDATGAAVSVPVEVAPVDSRVTILDWRPRTIQVVLDPFISRSVPVRIDRGVAPSDLEVGETIVDPATVTVSGPSSVVSRVDVVRAAVAIDPTGLDVDRDVLPQAVDLNGDILAPVDIEPSSVHVTIPVFANRQSRSVPISPVITGTPAIGFRIAAVSVDPLVVSVEGDADQLAALIRADTQPVAISGASGDLEVVVSLALPTGVLPLSDVSVRVTVRIEPITETRTFVAGLRLDGLRPGYQYALSVDRVLLTLFGSVADLDRLGSIPLEVGLNVSALGPGNHQVSVIPVLPTGVTIAARAPEIVTVTVEPPATPTPAPTPSPTAGPTPSPSGP